MTYTVKEIYYTLQGEGSHSGRAAVFCRFTGCNLWSGHEEDRGKAVCRFCDTDFLGTDGPSGGKFKSSELLAKAVSECWPNNKGVPYVVCTGGEPLLQLDNNLIVAFKKCGFVVGVETNGTHEAPDGLDWICVSPKANQPLKLTGGDELKLVYPQEEVDPAKYANLHFKHFYLQPLDNVNLEQNTQKAINYCLKHPQWRLSTQMHKIVNID